MEENNHCVSGLGTYRLSGLGSRPHHALKGFGGGLWWSMFGAVPHLGEGWMSAGVRGELGRIIMRTFHTTARGTPCVNQRDEDRSNKKLDFFYYIKIRLKI